MIKLPPETIAVFESIKNNNSSNCFSELVKMIDDIYAAPVNKGYDIIHLNNLISSHNIKLADDLANLILAIKKITPLTKPIDVKYCPSEACCGDGILVPIRTQQIRICSSCAKTFDWALDFGQPGIGYMENGNHSKK